MGSKSEHQRSAHPPASHAIFHCLPSLSPNAHSALSFAVILTLRALLSKHRSGHLPELHAVHDVGIKSEAVAEALADIERLEKALKENPLGKVGGRMECLQQGSGL